VTIEELAGLLLGRLKARPEVAAWDLHSIQIGVSSDVGQWAYSESERG
jgi:6-pyruvoyltetrahydropterin/6-carboxytetrahydropterin synthase